MIDARAQALLKKWRGLHTVSCPADPDKWPFALDCRCDMCQETDALLASAVPAPPEKDWLTAFRARIVAQPHQAPCLRLYDHGKDEDCVCWMQKVLDMIDADLQERASPVPEAPQLKATFDDARCDGTYPVPQTSPPRDEPFAVTYRCALHKGHEGPHGAEAPVSREQEK